MTALPTVCSSAFVFQLPPQATLAYSDSTCSHLVKEIAAAAFWATDSAQSSLSVL